MVQVPAFYLTTAGEYEPLTEPRTCTFVARLSDARRDDYMAVDIDPPHVSNESSLSGSRLILAAKWRGESLFAATRWPIPVYVICPVDDSLFASEEFRSDQVRLIAWGTVHQTFEEAAQIADQFTDE